MLAVALIAIAAFYGAFIAGAFALARRADDAADYAAHQLPHGDVVKLPIGATPKALTSEGRK